MYLYFTIARFHPIIIYWNIKIYRKLFVRRIFIRSRLRTTITMFSIGETIFIGHLNTAVGSRIRARGAWHLLIYVELPPTWCTCTRVSAALPALPRSESRLGEQRRVADWTISRSSSCGTMEINITYAARPRLFHRDYTRSSVKLRPLLHYVIRIAENVL